MQYNTMAACAVPYTHRQSNIHYVYVKFIIAKRQSDEGDGGGRSDTDNRLCVWCVCLSPFAFNKKIYNYQFGAIIMVWYMHTRERPHIPEPMDRFKTDWLTDTVVYVARICIDVQYTSIQQIEWEKNRFDECRINIPLNI